MNDATPTKWPNSTAPVRVVALEWNSPMLIEVLVELSKRYGWQPVYCVSEGTRELLKRRFPGAVYHDTVDARFGRPAPELADIPLAVLDQPAAEALGYAEIITLKQMDRMELLGGFALHDRITHFHRLAGYWSAVFDRLRPDVLLMPTSPHVTYDCVAYALARRRGIRAIMFEYVASEGLLMAIDGFEDGLPPLVAAYRRLRAEPSPRPVVLSERMEKYWRSLQARYEDALPYWVRLGRVAAEAKKTNPLARHLRLAVSRLYTNPWRPWRWPLHLARAVRDALEPPSAAGHYDGRFYRAEETPRKIMRKVARLGRKHGTMVSRYYDGLAVAPDIGRPYVYVALHAQPERSTNPNGGVFDDQDVMIGLIAAALPAGWRIYVKEHPFQFLHFASERGRWIASYDAMLSHPGVSLVPRNTPSFDLIDHARAVASITGTSSWEAVARGVPALLFGEAWYKGCDGVHSVRTIEDCRRALQRISAGERPDAQAVRLFLMAAEASAIEAFLNEDDASIARIDRQTNLTTLARAIEECFQLGSFTARELAADTRA